MIRGQKVVKIGLPCLLFVLTSAVTAQDDTPFLSRGVFVAAITWGTLLLELALLPVS